MDIEKQLGVVKAESRDNYGLNLVMFNVEIKDSPIGLDDGHYFYLHVDFAECDINYAEKRDDDIIWWKSFKLSTC